MMEAFKLADDPFEIFGAWFAAAAETEPSDPNAMTLATADASGRPAARTVLLKAWDQDGFVFYGNLGSRKGRHLAEKRAGGAAFLLEDTLPADPHRRGGDAGLGCPGG